MSSSSCVSNAGLKGIVVTEAFTSAVNAGSKI